MASSVATTTSARPSSSAGPLTARAGDDEADRHDAARLRQRPGDPAPGVEARDALADVGTAGVEHADDRHARVDGCA